MAKELDNLVAELATRSQLDQPEQDDQGRYFLVFDDEFEVSLLQVADKIYAEGRIGPIPAQRNQAEDLLTRSLQKHLARLRNKQEVLSIDARDNQLVLFRQLSARDLRVTELEAALGELTNGLEFWSGEVNQTQARPIPAAIPVPRMQMLFP